jgi:hypothetical protein
VFLLRLVALDRSSRFALLTLSVFALVKRF